MDGRERAAEFGSAGAGVIAVRTGGGPRYRPRPVLRGVGLRLRGRAWETLCGARPRSVLALGLLALGLLAAGLRGCAPGVFWASVGGWAALLGASFGLLRGCRKAD
ncbi:hypothetical protein ACFXAF_27400 [Kitasatospora sp. NPDC059463]|uniref:hypothetical protein n=1 Tax=unclassified Kitasatospora TaxID=2633591 RepID=UPI003686FB76